MTDEIKEKVSAWIKEDWSPEQVAGSLKDDGVISLHHEIIYRSAIVTLDERKSKLRLALLLLRRKKAQAVLASVVSYLIP